MNGIFNNTSNAIIVLYLLIRRLKIPITYYSVKNVLENHPTYPSLLSLSDSLTYWKVPNKAYEIDKNTCIGEVLSTPFIAHLKKGGGQFILVEEIKKGKVSFSNEEEIDLKINEIDFYNEWDGIVLYANKTSASGENNYLGAWVSNWLYKARVPMLILVILATILLTLNFTIKNWQYYSLLIIKLAGVLISILLLIHSINSNNPFIQNLCNLGKNNNCNAILKSGAANITSWLTWSEVGVFYFFGSLLYLLIIPSSVITLSVLNVLTLPYTFYSIGYQFKAKKWCVLCCSIQCLLWLEAFAFLSNGYIFQLSNATYNMKYTMLFLLCFSFPVFTWNFLKPYFMDSLQLKPLKIQLNSFKYDSELFDRKLKSQPKYDISDDLMPLVFGNPLANNVITMVSNPFCPPCGNAHKKINEWMQFRNDLQLKVIFLTADNDDDDRTQISRHLNALSSTSNYEIIEKALSDWYMRKYSVKEWIKNFPVQLNERTRLISKRQKEWSDLADITHTPMIFINGYKLPPAYTVDDIKYIFD